MTNGQRFYDWLSWMLTTDMLRFTADYDDYWRLIIIDFTPDRLNVDNWWAQTAEKRRFINWLSVILTTGSADMTLYHNCWWLISIKLRQIFTLFGDWWPKFLILILQNVDSLWTWILQVIFRPLWIWRLILILLKVNGGEIRIKSSSFCETKTEQFEVTMLRE